MARVQAQPSPVSPAADDTDAAKVAAAVRQILGRDLTAVVAAVASANLLARQSGGDRPLSPEIAGRMRAAHGIAYLTRFDPGRTCWAIFEHVDPGLPTDIDIRRIATDDPDRRAVGELFGRPLP